MSDSPTIHDPKQLRLWRHAAGLNQKDLADITDLDQSYISYLENGHKSPTPKTLKKIADALGCEVVDLLRERPKVRRQVKAAA